MQRDPLVWAIANGSMQRNPLVWANIDNDFLEIL